MANVNVTVTGTLLDGAGAAVVSAAVNAKRIDPSPLQAATLAVADTATATSNASTGVFSLTLVGHSAFPVFHRITFPDKRYIDLRLPANAKSVGLGKVQTGGSPAKAPLDMTGHFTRIKFIGQDLASATALPEPTCDIHAVTGTTAITSITAGDFPVGATLTLNFASTPTFTDGNNLKLAANLVATADDTITLYFDGTNFFEIGRSVN